MLSKNLKKLQSVQIKQVQYFTVVGVLLLLLLQSTATTATTVVVAAAAAAAMTNQLSARFD